MEFRLEEIRNTIENEPSVHIK